MEFRCCGEKSREIEDVGKTYGFLRAIADPNRLKIICVLQSGPRFVCEIVPIVGISDKLASHHLKQLKKTGILTEKREGNFIRYGLDRKAIKDHKAIFNKIIK